MRLLLSLTLAGVAMAAETTRPPWDAFDNNLAAILRSAADGFHDLQGARVENRRREFFYESKTYLPEARYCRLFTLGDQVFCCEWDGLGRAGAEAAYRKLVSRIEAALGSGWSKVEKSSPKRTEVVFTSERKPVVQATFEPEQAQVHVLVLVPGSPKTGFSGEIPSIVGFVHP